MYKTLKERQPPAKLEASGRKNSEDLHRIMSGIIPEDGTFHHHELI